VSESPLSFIQIYPPLDYLNALLSASSVIQCKSVQPLKIVLLRIFIKEIFKQQLNCKKTNGEEMKQHLEEARNSSVADSLKAVKQVVEHSSLCIL
jgi:hypothetical protein